MGSNLNAWLRLASFMFAAALSGCAAASTHAPAAPGAVVRTTGSFNTDVPLSQANVELSDTIAFDAARVWSELPRVYRALALPVNATDTRARRLGAVEFEPRRMEDQPLSRFLDCGRGITAGENADTYRVTLSVETRVEAEAVSAGPQRSVIRSFVSATARPRATSGNPVPCQSKGGIERRIVELLRQRLAARPSD